jgi:hypothetical protein
VVAQGAIAGQRFLDQRARALVVAVHDRRQGEVAGRRDEQVVITQLAECRGRCCKGYCCENL